MNWKLRSLVAGGLLLSSAATAGAEELTVMGWVGLFDFQKPGWEKIVSEFEAQNPGVTINYVATPFEDTLNQATVAIMGNNAPDVVQVVSGWVPQLVEMGALAPLNEHLPEDEIGQFASGSIDAVTFDSDVMALTWIPGPIMMGYNRDLMERAGLDPDQPPKTWPEFVDAVDKICALESDDGETIYGVSLRTSRNPNSAHWALPMVWANGGSVVSEDGKVSFNQEGVRKAFEWYRDVVNKGCSPDAFDIQATRNVFAQGRAGFIFEGPWVRGLVNNLSGGKLSVAPDGDVWVAAMPSAADGKVRQIANSNMLVMTEQAENKELAAKFISFVLGNAETVEHYFETSGQMSTGRLDLLSSGQMGADPYVGAFIGVLNDSNPVPIKKAQWNAILDAVAPALQSIIKGGDPEKELANADRQIDRLLGQ